MKHKSIIPKDEYQSYKNDFNKEILNETNQPKETMTKIYMAVKYPQNFTGKKDINIITLEEHLKKYNSICDNIGDGLQLFLNENDARKHLNKINK